MAITVPSPLTQHFPPPTLEPGVSQQPKPVDDTGLEVPVTHPEGPETKWSPVVLGIGVSSVVVGVFGGLLWWWKRTKRSIHDSTGD